MKTSRFILLAVLCVSMVFLSSCKDDPEEELSPYIGNYIITDATLSEPLTLQTNEIGPMTVPAGTDITIMIQSALLGSIECDPNLSIIQLLEDLSLFLSCTNTQQEIDAGTWEEISETVIVLNLNSVAIPSSPTGFVLTVTDVALSNNILSGATSVPISEENLITIVQLMSQGNATLDEEATPDAVPISLTIELTKQ